MIDLWYLNTRNISREEVRSKLGLLPQEMAHEISRFRNHEDRCLKLYGRLMVSKYYHDKGMNFKWCEWKVSSDGKPYYGGNKKFNISHSGEYVLVAFSDHEIGADIEMVTDFDVASASIYFHPLEIDYMKSTGNSTDAFFRLWTRKEAYLKALGKGIINGLHNENCLPEKITNKDMWFIHSLSLIPGYKVALCAQIADCRIEARELSPEEFPSQPLNKTKVDHL